MFDTDVIVTLNSKNISLNPDKTKERVVEILTRATKQQRDSAAALGGYNDARSFNKTKASGLISVRMVITLAIVFNLDPHFISADTDVKTEYSEERAKNFLIKNGFRKIALKEIWPTDEDLITYVSRLLKNMSSKTKESVHNLEDDKLSTMLKAYLIRSKVGVDEDLRLFLIKSLLIGG